MDCPECKKTMTEIPGGWYTCSNYKCFQFRVTRKIETYPTARQADTESELIEQIPGHKPAFE